MHLLFALIWLESLNYKKKMIEYTMEENLNILHEKALKLCELEDVDLRKLGIDIIFTTIKYIICIKNKYIYNK